MDIGTFFSEFASDTQSSSSGQISIPAGYISYAFHRVKVINHGEEIILPVQDSV